MAAIGEKILPVTNIRTQTQIGIVQYHVVLLLNSYAASAYDEWWIAQAVRLAITDIFNVTIFGNKSDVLIETVRVLFANAGAGNDHLSLIVA